MQSKYKISLLRGNLLAAAVALALWTKTAPPQTMLLLWLSIGWLLITALLLEFSHRRSRGLPWQLVPGLLLLGLIAADPTRHALLFWTWAALLMLPQRPWVLAVNLLAAGISLVLLRSVVSDAGWWLLVGVSSVLVVLAISWARQLTDMNGAIRQRLRLVPGLNLWPGEQLLKDLPREQTRCEREAIHGELLVLHVKRHHLWSTTRKLCELTHNFENGYRLDGTTLATVLLARSPGEAEQRRKRLLAALPNCLASTHYPLLELETEDLDIASFKQPSTSLRPRERA
ncbi:hypothetical protein R5M92_06035 [Halomonas sp. Bachu 37]|uniref:hypothetical protein n=1 Tax=Halomonas kashgarensis TaxID=3084920 RepID=UPI003216DCA3